MGEELGFLPNGPTPPCPKKPGFFSRSFFLSCTQHILEMFTFVLYGFAFQFVVPPSDGLKAELQTERQNERCHFGQHLSRCTGSSQTTKDQV